eukprot:scaffold17383_cov18-Prasinocladus_malaysianus.AAC.1
MYAEEQLLAYQESYLYLGFGLLLVRVASLFPQPQNILGGAFWTIWSRRRTKGCRYRYGYRTGSATVHATEMYSYSYDYRVVALYRTSSRYVRPYPVATRERLFYRTWRCQLVLVRVGVYASTPITKGTPCYYGIPLTPHPSAYALPTIRDGAFRGEYEYGPADRTGQPKMRRSAANSRHSVRTVP